jgi:hypothetical protein
MTTESIGGPGPGSDSKVISIVVDPGAVAQGEIDDTRGVQVEFGDGEGRVDPQLS